MLHTYYDYNFCFLKIFVSQSFRGNIGLRIWSSPNCVTYGTEVHYYIIITVLMVIFSKLMSFKFFRVKLIQKSEVIQINRNWVQGCIPICILRFYCLFLQRFVIHIILSKFCPKIRCPPNWLESSICVHY